MKTAIVHYWLVSMRGGEKVLEALLELFPQADIFTHVYDPSAVSETIKAHRVFTSRINRLPFAKRHYQKYLPFMPDALRDFNLQDYDLVISSEAGPAKGVVPNPDAYHLCYCHSPMRYIWDMAEVYGKNGGALARLAMRLFTPRLRVWDTTSANLVDRFVTNSRFVSRRILRYYRREAEVVPPPVDVEKYTTQERFPQDYYLYLGQLADYKRADLAIEACLAGGKKLVLAGGGGKVLAKKYRRESGITFAGRVSDVDISRYYAEAKALLFPGVEDFGLVPVEAAAAGCPVIAFRKGGAVETVKENVTGLFFDEQTPESLLAAIQRFEETQALYTNRVSFTTHARQFSKEAFKEHISRIIAERKCV